MRNIEALITEIQRVLDDVEKFPRGQVARLADWYSSEVNAFNQRVIEALDSEQAETAASDDYLLQQDQPLIPLFSILKFDRLKKWRKLVAQYDLPALEELDVERWETWRQLDAHGDRLTLLLDQYQLVILSKAPAFARHSILRRLSHLDETSWRPELKNFEKYRFEELDRQLDQAETDFDKSSMDKAIKEFRSIPWLSKIPEPLSKKVAEKESAGYGGRVEYQLGQLAKEMLLHFEARDWEKANRLKNEWKRLYALAENSAKQKMAQEMEDVLDWADETKAAQSKAKSSTAKSSTAKSSRRTAWMLTVCAVTILVAAAALGISWLL